MDHQKMYRPYTPARQDEDFLERTTSGRRELLSDLLAGIKSQSSKPTHQHWLLIGPWGRGLCAAAHNPLYVQFGIMCSCRGGMGNFLTKA